MVDNSFQKEYIYQNTSNSEDKNSLVNTLKEFEKIYKNPSTIENNSLSDNSLTNNSTINNLNNELKENESPYIYKDKIPEIKIKDENNLINGEKIENYINFNSNSEFNDNIYNICEKCGKNNNHFFCENCLKNICNICTNECQNNNHKLMQFQKIKKEINHYIKDINRTISEYFIEPEKNEMIFEQEEETIYQQFGESQMNYGEHKEKFKTYTNDILLVKSIINKNYDNYFHYKNIENCYRYIKKKYDINNQMLIEYKIKGNEKKIKILGEGFVFNNIKKVFIIYEEEEFELDRYFELKNEITNNILKIKLIGTNNITNMNWMFSNCTSLISLSFISKGNTNNVTKMGGMFYNCTSLKYINDISKWNIEKVTNINRIFHGCTSLTSLPDISTWNTSEITNMRGMFSNCISLKSLPDISYWNTNKVINMSEMFSFCTSLTTLPDISNWNTNNVTNMRGMFDQCFSLKSLPDISKWNTNKVTDLSSMFSFCTSLNSLPDISKWNTNCVNDISNLFYCCISLNSLPSISKWNTENITDMNEIFSFCTSLNSLPDITKWNIKKISNISRIFYGCISLEFVPNIYNLEGK